MCYNEKNEDPCRTPATIFWGTDLSKIDIEENKQYIIERILELGDNDAVQWLLSNVSLCDIKKTLERSRRISRKSKNFWSIFLEDQPDAWIHFRRKDKRKFSTPFSARFYRILLPCRRNGLCFTPWPSDFRRPRFLFKERSHTFRNAKFAAKKWTFYCWFFGFPNSGWKIQQNKSKLF